MPRIYRGNKSNIHREIKLSKFIFTTYLIFSLVLHRLFLLAVCTLLLKKDLTCHQFAMSLSYVLKEAVVQF